LEIVHKGNSYFLETTIDIPFQQYMAERILTSKAPAGAFVALNPINGEILSLIEFNHMPGLDHPSLIGRFPAASLFKIVSAAAAIEEKGYCAESTMSFNGRKHTLYKKQLTEQTNRYTNQVSLKKSFAQSINPIFGKLGCLQLKKELLEKYAARFGFNEVIGFELPIEPSGFVVSDNPYEWAEIASGFNRRTVISPVHAAVIAASTLNGGKLMEPTIVRRMTDKSNQIVYQGAPHVIRQAISPEASRELKTLMTETITHGTSRRAFRGYNRDRVLSKIEMGGKTGTIKNQSGDLLYDWFVGFAADRQGDRKLAIGVLMVHNTLLRARSHEFARVAFKEYFKAKPPTGS
jgi:cell division protein FtsI/penicillin-binding protein 2